MQPCRLGENVCRNVRVVLLDRKLAFDDANRVDRRVSASVRASADPNPSARESDTVSIKMMALDSLA